MGNDQQAQGAQTELANLQLGNKYDIRRVGDKWVGPWHAIHWDQMRSIAVTMLQLSSQICERPIAEFGLDEFIFSEGAKAFVGIRMFHNSAARLNDAAVAKCDAALAELLRVITSDTSSRNLPFDEALAPDIEAAAAKVGLGFLKKHGGNDVRVRIDVSIGRGNELVQVSRLAPKPVETIDSAEKHVTGFCEGFDRPDRACHIVDLDGQNIWTSFAVSVDLQRLREIACDDKPYMFTIANVLDANGRPDLMVRDFKRTEDVDGIPRDLVLTPSPQSTRKGRRGRRRTKGK